MASSSPRVDSTPQLPDYVPVPEAAFGPARNEQGYFADRLERNLFWVTDGAGLLPPPCRPRRRRLTGPPMTEEAATWHPVLKAPTEVAV
jgi:hypothetical protein